MSERVIAQIRGNELRGRLTNGPMAEALSRSSVGGQCSIERVPIGAFENGEQIALERVTLGRALS